MRFVCVADTHGKVGISGEFKRDLDGSDGLILAGDITHFGGSEEVRDVLESFGVPLERILAVSGNCDRQDGVGYLKDSGVSLKGQ